MRRALRVKKRIQVVTPGGKNVIHFKKGKPSHAKCGNCGKKLNRPRLNPIQVRKLSKVQRRPERPFPYLCSRCMREYLKEKLRG